MIVLMQTDLPEPCARNEQVRHLGDICHHHLACNVLSGCKGDPGRMVLEHLALQQIPGITALLVLLGTSMPTAALPGIGASIRISAAARFSLMSSRQAHDLAHLHALLRLQFIPGHRRATAHIGDRHVDTEIVHRVPQQAAVSAAAPPVLPPVALPFSKDPGAEMVFLQGIRLFLLLDLLVEMSSAVTGFPSSAAPTLRRMPV